jgi:hypothetical protein
MFLTNQDDIMQHRHGKIIKKKPTLLLKAGIGMILALGASMVSADNAVKLKVLVVSTGDQTQDPGLAYITPVLDEMGVPYTVLNSATETLTDTKLSPQACLPAAVGCVGNYNGVILTNSDLALNFTPDEWDMLHKYEADFRVRESVILGWTATYYDPAFPYGIYLDYGLSYSSSPSAPFNAQWTIPASINKEVFEYVNTANPLTISDFAFTAVARNDGIGPRDGTIPSVTPLLTVPSTTASDGTRTPGGNLVSIIRYTQPGQTTPAREVMFSSISNASFLLHSQALAYELVNFATQGVYVGGRYVYLAAQADDLFLPNALWDTLNNVNNYSLTYRLNSNDINNAVAKQAAFRLTHPSVGNFRIDFPFNGRGAVIDQNANFLQANFADGLVKAIYNNRSQFRYISHTFTHADMDKAPVIPNAPCDYDTYTTTQEFQAEITKNRTVWGLLGLPEQSQNNRVIITGVHSGLKDRKCTANAEFHPEMANVQDDDVPYVEGANSTFFTAAANTGVSYVASDSSQLNQNKEEYISGVSDGSTSDRIMLPRWPTNIFVNTINPDQLVDEYNYVFYEKLGSTPGGIKASRNYNEILAAEADQALRHMLTYKKWPHFFHQSNLAAYDAAGNTLQFDWLHAVYSAYEKMFKLPVINDPYYMNGDKTRDRLIAKSAVINAVWNRSKNQVILSANKSVPNLTVTGLFGGSLYGGQSIRSVNISPTTSTFTVDRALSR